VELALGHNKAGLFHVARNMGFAFFHVAVSFLGWFYLGIVMEFSFLSLSFFCDEFTIGSRDSRVCQCSCHFIVYNYGHLRCCPQLNTYGCLEN
jgi:hypothetical protein